VHPDLNAVSGSSADRDTVSEHTGVAQRTRSTQSARVARPEHRGTNAHPARRNAWCARGRTDQYCAGRA